MNILVFGDSITQGFDDTEMGGWVSRLFCDVSARKSGQNHSDFKAVFNLGVSGDTTDAVLRRFTKELEARLDDSMLIIFDIGGNDYVRNLQSDECQVPFDRFSKNYTELISLGKKYGRVVCLGLHDSDESRLNPIPHYAGHACLTVDHEKYDAEVERLCTEYDVLYINMTGLLAEDFARYTYDGDHPSALGHTRIYERVRSELVANGIL